MLTDGRGLSGVGRTCLVIGAVVLLIGNLIPHSGAKGAVLVVGEVFVIIGIVGLVIGRFVKPRVRPNEAEHSGAHPGNQHSGQKRSRGRR